MTTDTPTRRATTEGDDEARRIVRAMYRAAVNEAAGRAEVATAYRAIAEDLVTRALIRRLAGDEVSS